LLRDSVNSSVALRWLRLSEQCSFAVALFVLGISVGGEIWREETKALIPRVLEPGRSPDSPRRRFEN